MNARITLIVVEVLAVAALRAVYLLHKDRAILPRSSKVGKVSGRPVFSASEFVGRFVRRGKDRGPKQPETLQVGPFTIPLADPDAGEYDTDPVE